MIPSASKVYLKPNVTVKLELKIGPKSYPIPRAELKIPDAKLVTSSVYNGKY